MQGAIQAAGYRPSDENNMMDNDKMLSGFLNDVFFGHGLSELRLIPRDNGRVIPVLVNGGLEHAKRIIETHRGMFNIYGTFNELNHRRFPKKSGAAGDDDVTRRLFFFVDIDAPDHNNKAKAPDVETAKEKAREIYDYLVYDQGWPEPYVACSGGGVHMFFRCADDVPNDRGLFERALQGLAAEFGPMVDTGVFNSSRIARVPGAPNTNYSENGEPLELETPVLQLGTPDAEQGVTEEELEELGKAAAVLERPKEAGAAQRGGPVKGGGLDLEDWMERHGVPWEKKGLWQGEVMYTMCCPGCGGRDFHVGKYPGGALYANCFHVNCEWHKKKGWRDFRKLHQPDWEPPAKPHYTQKGFVRLLAEEAKDEAAWVPELKSWLLWNGKWWEEDDEAHLLSDRLDALLLWLEKQAPPFTGDKELDRERQEYIAWLRKAENKNYRSGIFDMAKTPLRRRLREFDAQPGLLNCKNGVVNMRDGELRPHNPNLRITRYIDINYNPKAFSKEWWQMLCDIMTYDIGRVDLELLRYLLLSVGYTATGEHSEEMMWICVGPTSSNGKTELLEEAIFRVLGGISETSYAAAMDYSLITAMTRKVSRPGEASPHKTALRGVRYLVLTESDLGEKISEAEIKKLVSSSIMVGRNLYAKKNLLFNMEASMWLLTNHEPPLNDYSGAAMRRLTLFPFKMHFYRPDKKEKIEKILKNCPWAKQRVVKLGVKLAKEHREAILATIVMAAMAWYESGFPETPKRALAEWEEYLEREDDFERFLGERFNTGRHFETTLKKIMAEAEDWCVEGQGWKKAWGRGTLIKMLKAKGMQPHTDGERRLWLGLAPLGDAEQVGLLGEDDDTDTT